MPLQLQCMSGIKFNFVRRIKMVICDQFWIEFYFFEAASPGSHKNPSWFFLEDVGKISTSVNFHRVLNVLLHFFARNSLQYQDQNIINFSELVSTSFQEKRESIRAQYRHSRRLCDKSWIVLSERASKVSISATFCEHFRCALFTQGNLRKSYSCNIDDIDLNLTNKFDDKFSKYSKNLKQERRLTTQPSPA
jgi:hypothetical protein